MSTRELFLAAIIERLETLGIAYMITGSLAAAYHGEPRATNDIDIVINPNEAQLDSFIGSFDDTFYVSADAARDALRRRSMFNVIDVTSGWKVDLIIRKAREFSQVEFARRRVFDFFGRPYFLVTAEDAILSKLEWAAMSGSERQLRDAAQIAAITGPALDVTYLRTWAACLQLEEALENLLSAINTDDASGEPS